LSIRFLILSLLAGLVLYACSKTTTIIDPPPLTFNAGGSWQLAGNDSIVMSVGVIENEDSNRVLICDMTSKGKGCMWGHLNSDHSISFDDIKFPDLLAENVSNNILKLSTPDGSQNPVTGNYNTKTWIQGNCGFYTIAGTTIGFVDKNCIIGNWYTLAPDPFGGPNQIIYKDYNLDGSGKLIIPDENKTITFKWDITGYPSNTLLNEYQFSDTSYVNTSYGYECNATGLALGIQGKSWIRKSVVCF
jgi:hypothetical protein